MRPEDRQWSVAFDLVGDTGCVVVGLGSGVELDRAAPVLHVGAGMTGATSRLGAAASEEEQRR